MPGAERRRWRGRRRRGSRLLLLLLLLHRSRVPTSVGWGPLAMSHVANLPTYHFSQASGDGATVPAGPGAHPRNVAPLCKAIPCTSPCFRRKTCKKKEFLTKLSQKKENTHGTAQGRSERSEAEKCCWKGGEQPAVERRAAQARCRRADRRAGSRGTWSTWSAVINLTSRARELRSAPSSSRMIGIGLRAREP